MINAADIADAESLAGRLTAGGFAAGVVHSRRRKAENRGVIEQLQAGVLRAVVHVNMLAEGVDFPWLRWLCLRRPVGARVRFIQEVGRVLRAAPGKTEAVLFDPHDLFGSFGWHYQEAIGEWEWAAKEKEELEAEEREERERAPRSATATDPITAWCRRLLLPLQASGLSPSDRVASTAWRMDVPSEQQLRYLAVMTERGAWELLPAPHGELVGLAVRRPGVLTRGGASDLISVGKALQRYDYPKGIEVEPPAEEHFETARAVNSDPAWYAAAAYRKTSPLTSFVVFHGGKVVSSQVRPRRADEGWVMVQREAAGMAQWAARDAGEAHPDVVIDSVQAARAVRCRCVSDAENPARAMAWRALAMATKKGNR